MHCHNQNAYQRNKDFRGRSYMAIKTLNVNSERIATRRELVIYVENGGDFVVPLRVAGGGVRYTNEKVAAFKGFG